MAVEVTNVDWNPEKSRRAEVALVDTAGTPLRLVDYEGAENPTDWKERHRYRISRCRVQTGGGGYALELAPSKKTRIEPLGPAEQCTKLLVIGDTHVGRTEHPRTGEKIDPIGAFATAVDYGIEQGVDAVVHVGDIFHDTATPVQAAFVDVNVFDPLTDAEIPFYYVRGNHTATPGDEVLSERGETVFHLDTEGVAVGASTRVFGIDHHAEGRLPWSALAFPDSVSEPVNVLVVHQTLEQLSGRGPRSVDLGRVLRRSGSQFDLVISGHHHDASRGDWRGTTVMYVGAAERMSTNKNPTDRVAWILTVENESVSSERYEIP